MPPPSAGNKVFAVPCDVADVTQYSWSYDGTQQAVKGPGGKCLDAAGSAGGQTGSLFLNECDGSDLQQFTLGDDGTLNSVTQKGKCVDIWAGHGNPGGPGLQLYSCHGADNEKFIFETSGAVSSQGKVCLAGRDAAPATGEGELELWSKPLLDGKIAAFVLNHGDHVITSFDLADLNITGDVGVRDIWLKQDLPSVGGSISLELQKHDSAFLVLTPKQLPSVV